MTDITPITYEEIDAGMTPKGGFTRKQLEAWGVPWPPPSGWKDTLAAYGIPYQHEKNTFGKPKEPPITQEVLQKIMDESHPRMTDGEPFDCDGQLDIDAGHLLQKVVAAVINHGHADILWEFPEVLAFFGSRIPEQSETEHLHAVDDRMFDAAKKWPNRKSGADNA